MRFCVRKKNLATRRGFIGAKPVKVKYGLDGQFLTWEKKHRYIKNPGYG